MDRVAASCRIFDPNSAVQIAPAAVVGELAADTPIFEAWHDGIEATHLDGSFAAGKGSAVFGVDIDDPRGTKPELRRQRPGNKRDVVSKACLQFLTEAGDTFGQEHIVETILQVGVFAA